MASQIKNVIFDLGGVLIDWNPEYLYRKLIPDTTERQRFLTEICTPAWHTRHDEGVPFEQNAKPLLEKYADDKSITSWILAWRDRFNEMNKRPISGTVDVLNELRAAQTHVFALTNWSAEFFPPPRERFPFLSAFEDIVVSGIERVAKPDPKIYEILLERTKINPEESVFIDNMNYNLPPAAQLGLKTVLFVTPEALRTDLVNLGLPLSSSLPLLKKVCP